MHVRNAQVAFAAKFCALTPRILRWFLGFLKKKLKSCGRSKQEDLRCRTETFPEFKLLLSPSCTQFRFISLLLLLLLLLLRWHYSPMRTFASSLDLSQSALFLF